MSYKTVVYQDFSGGWNPKWSLNATQLADNQSPFLVNVDYAARYAFTKRRGTTALGDVSVAAGSVKSLYTYINKAGTEKLLRSTGTKMQYLDTGTGLWTDITGATTFTTDLKFDFQTQGDNVFFGNGTDDWAYWNGVGAITTNAGYPKGNIYTSAFLRMWIAGQSVDPTQVNYSSVGDYTVMSGGTSGSTTFPSRVTSLVPFYDRSGTERLHVHCKDGSVYEIFFDSSGVLNKQRVRTFGSSQFHRTTCRVENDIWGVSTDQQARSLGYEANVADVRSNSQSVPIDTYMALLNYTDAAAIYASRTYLMAARETGASANNIMLLFDRNYGSWRKYTGLAANMFAMYAGKVAFASAVDPNVYTFDSSYYSDSNIPIYAEYQTKDWDFENALDLQRVRFVKVSGLISAGANVPVKGYFDGNTNAVGFTKTIRGNGPYVQSSIVYPWGSAAFGIIPFAGLGGGTSVIPVSPFTVIMSLDADTHANSLRLAFQNQEADVDFIITTIKPYYEVDAFDRVPKSWWI